MKEDLLQGCISGYDVSNLNHLYFIKLISQLICNH